MTTKIQWCEETWNPIVGCSPISEACTHCYAQTMANRQANFAFARNDLEAANAYGELTQFRKWTGKIHVFKDRFKLPRWRKPMRVFVGSMTDMFHEKVDDRYMAAMLGIAAFCQQHDFLFLTKRADRMGRFFNWMHRGDYASNLNWWKNEACSLLSEKDTKWIRLRPEPKSLPLPNVWMGVTAENQKRADERIPVLLQIPAAVRFVSVEPMLGRMDLIKYLIPPLELPVESPIPPSLDWVICGPETGPGKRPFNFDWARDLRDQCKAAGVPFFYKKHDDPNTPDDLRIAEFPITAEPEAK